MREVPWEMEETEFQGDAASSSEAPPAAAGAADVAAAAPAAAAAAGGKAAAAAAAAGEAAAAPPLRGRAKAIAMARAKAAAAGAATSGAGDGGPEEGGPPSGINGSVGSMKGPSAKKRVAPELLTPAGALAGRLLPLVSLGTDEGLLEDEVSLFIDECCSSSSSSSTNEEGLVVYGSTGRLTGRYTKRPISLPVATPCLLSSDVSQLLFDEALSQQHQHQQLQQILQQLLQGDRRAYAARQLPSSIQIVDVLHEGGPSSTDAAAAAAQGGAPQRGAPAEQNGGLEEEALGSRSLIYSLVDAQQQQQHQQQQQQQQQRTVKVVQQVLLGRKLIYRPRSSRHLQITVLSETSHPLTPISSSSSSSSNGGASGELPPELLRDLQGFGFVRDASTDAATPTDAAAAAAAVRVAERKVVRCESWVFSPILQQQQQQQQQLLLPEWVVELRREVDEGDISSHPQLLLQQLQHAAADTSSGLGADADVQQDNRRVSIRLYAPSQCLQQQQRKQQQQQQQQQCAFSALVSLFLYNLNAAIADPLDAAETAALGTVVPPLYYPGILGDNQQVIQSFYETRRITAAADSPITALRLHNNQVGIDV